jgi:hypothetical protein
VATRNDPPIAGLVTAKGRGPERVSLATENLRAFRQDRRDRGFEPLAGKEILSAIRESRLC